MSSLYKFQRYLLNSNPGGASFSPPSTTTTTAINPIKTTEFKCSRDVDGNAETVPAGVEFACKLTLRDEYGNPTNMVQAPRQLESALPQVKLLFEFPF